MGYHDNLQQKTTRNKNCSREFIASLFNASCLLFRVSLLLRVAVLSCCELSGSHEKLVLSVAWVSLKEP